MLIEPQAAPLLARICDTLEKTALADMASPYAQRQLKAGLYALRDLGVRIAAQPLWIGEDIGDMAGVLAALGVADSPADDSPLTDVQRHLQLQGRLEAFEAGLEVRDMTPASRTAGLRELRALYLRMLERERMARRGGATADAE